MFYRLLLKMHLLNFASGQTTQEKFGYKARLRKLRQERAEKSRLSQNLISNEESREHSNSFTLSQISFTQDYVRKKQNCVNNCLDMGWRNRKAKQYNYEQV